MIVNLRRPVSSSPFLMEFPLPQIHIIGEVIRPPTVVSLKGRLPQKLQPKSIFSCEIVQIHSLFRHGFYKETEIKLEFNRNRK